MTLYDEFLKITKTLNEELDIIPVLYGSLGLEKATGVNFSPEDIDILVPLVFLGEKWDLFKSVMEQSEYELVDLQEHEFRKDQFKIGVAYIEDLQQFADVNYNQLKENKDEDATFYTLTISEYLKVYNKSVLDGYRRTKNNNKDQDKLKILNELLQN